MGIDPACPGFMKPKKYVLHFIPRSLVIVAKDAAREREQGGPVLALSSLENQFGATCRLGLRHFVFSVGQ